MAAREITGIGVLALMCVAVLAALLLAACAGTPPRNQEDICSVLDQHPAWYDYAVDAEERWGVPKHVLLSFVRFESGFRSSVKPPRDWFLRVIPLPRDSSAYGYAQAQNFTWKEYLEDTDGGWFTDRDNMADALDFVGWYNHRSHEELGISVWDPKNLYLAYHEGRGGYRSGTWRNKPGLLERAEQVDWQAREYGAQLSQCEDRFKCDAWYQFWPFCRK